MFATKLAGMAQAATVRDHVNFLVDVYAIVGYPFKFFFYYQPALQLDVMCRDTGGTGIGVTAQGLNAAQ